MRDGRPFLDLIDQVYAAAADPECWQQALDSFTAFYPGGRGTILHHDVKLGSGSFPIVSTTWDRSWVDRYNGYFANVNPWLKNLKKRPVGLAVPAEFMLERASLVKTEFYHDFMKPQEMMSAIGVTINQDRDRFIAVSVILPESTANNERDNVGLLQRLAPHFRRAMQLNRQLARASIDSAAAQSGLDCLAAGFVLVDHDGRCIFNNRAAARIFADADGLALDRDGSVIASTQRETAALRAFIHGAATALDIGARSHGGTLKVGRPSGRSAYSVMVSPIRPRASRLAAGSSIAALVITENRSFHVPAAELASIFGITPAEAKVLSLILDGKSMPEASKALGISLMTTRTHVKHLFEKLGCARQSDLVRIVMQHPVWLLDRT